MGSRESSTSAPQPNALRTTASRCRRAAHSIISVKTMNVPACCQDMNGPVAPPVMGWPIQAATSSSMCTSQ